MLTEGRARRAFELLDESGMDQGWLKPGQRVEAMIVKITPEWVFIDVGGQLSGGNIQVHPPNPSLSN